jgi:hypothetical protein
VEHTQMHSRRVQFFSITLAIPKEFLVNSLFQETKIPIVDMKVLVYSNFNKNKIWKKNEISKLHEGWKISSFQV